MSEGSGSQQDINEGQATINNDIGAVLQGLRGDLITVGGQIDKMASKEWVESWQREQDRARNRDRLFIVVVCIAILITFVMLGYGLLKITSLVEEVRTTSDATIGCTSPGPPENPNPCYAQRQEISKQNNDQQTKDIVDGLFQRIITYLRAEGYDTRGANRPSGSGQGQSGGGQGDSLGSERFVGPVMPSASPTADPTARPSAMPSAMPSGSPTSRPTAKPTRPTSTVTVTPAVPTTTVTSSPQPTTGPSTPQPSRTPVLCLLGLCPI